MRYILLSLLCLTLGCTAAQKNWRDNLYLDVSAGGNTDPRATVTSAGVNYPVVGNLWGSVGVWNNFDGSYGPYWGLSYSFAPFAKKGKTNGIRP